MIHRLVTRTTTRGPGGVLLALLALASCTSGSRLAAKPPAPAEAAPPAAVVTPERCGPAILGSELLIGSSRLVVLGEMHGTAEMAAFFGDLACRVALGKAPVWLGLEIPVQEQERFDRYLASAGTPADRALLLEGSHWHRPLEDGRSSVAVLRLVDTLRELRAAGLELRVFLFDDELVQEQQPRERAMAEKILAVRKLHPDEPMLVLVGNLHARTVKGARWDAELEWMGLYLAQSEPSFWTLDVSHAAGEAWVCMGTTTDLCHAHALKDRSLGQANDWALRLFDAPNPFGFHGTWHVGVPTASPPATAPAPNAP